MNKVISFALWGNIPQYTLGALKNVELAKKIYPDWKCRFYTDSTTSMVTLRDLHANGADVYQVKNEFGSWGGLFWRFYVVDDPSVDAFIIRDCDSRLSLREKSAVDQWLFSPFFQEYLLNFYYFLKLFSLELKQNCLLRKFSVIFFSLENKKTILLTKTLGNIQMEIEKLI